jgi:hypothetical protein
VAGGHTLNIKQGPGPRNPRHPARIRPGQMFFPRKGRQKLRVTVKRLDGEWVRVIREDGTESSLALDRLFARDEDGSGCHYRFHGWRFRPRGYRAELRVIDVSAGSGRCVLRLPEWDPDTDIEEALAVLPEDLRFPGAAGSCMANLASSSAAGLGIHSCRKSKVRDASREASGPHPEVLAEGQRFRKRGDGVKLRLLDTEGPKVSAWNGRRVVRVSKERLLAVGTNGQGRHYEYVGGGVAAMRSMRAARHRERSN